MSLTDTPKSHASTAHAHAAGRAEPQHAAHAAPQHDEHDALPKHLKKPHALTVTAMALLFLALLAGLFFLGYLPHQKAVEAAKNDADEAADDTAIVAVAHPNFAAVAKEVSLPCDIRPFQDTLIFPRGSGYLKKLNVDIHDRVEKDQVLAEIDAPEIDAQLLQAQASLQQAHADVNKSQSDLQLAQRTYDRYKSTEFGNQVSPQELDERASAVDEAKAVLAQTQANVAGAEANIQRLKTMQSFDIITAPFAGVITARNYDIGALLAPTGGREIFQLQQSDTVRVFVNMPQLYATQIHMGQTATLTVRNFPERVFQGTVARTADAINPNTRTMPFELHFPNADGALLPGMYGEAKIAINAAPKTLLVPVSAMLFNATGTQVACVVDGKAHFQQVSVGRDLGNEIEVLDGLSPDSQIITNPGERLIEGAPVKIATPLAPVNAAPSPMAAKTPSGS